MNRKQEKHTANGITLIALVITIIVMMILVGVTVTIATNGGLFDYAGKASDLQRAGMVEDHVNVWKSEKLMAKYAGGEVKTASELLDDLYEQNLITENERKEANSTGTIKIRDKEIVLKSDGETLVNLYNNGKIKIGDYIGFEIPESREYIAKGEKTGTTGYDQVFTTGSNQLKWQVMGIDTKTGGLKLVADGFVSKKNESTDKLTLYGAKGYVYGIKELNNICSIYKTNAVVEARSMNLDDFNEVTGMTAELLEDFIKNTGSTNFKKQVTLKPKELGTSFYTPERFLNGGEPEETYTKEGVYVYWSRGTAASEKLATYTDDIKNNLLRMNEKGEYWLATQRCYEGGQFMATYACFGGPNNSIGNQPQTLFSSPDSNNSGNYNIRPVVVLDKLATEMDIKYVDSSAIQDWTYEVDAKTNTITITGYHGTDEIVTIPSIINGMRVTKIQGKEKAQEAGYGNYKNSKSIWERQICTDKYYGSVSSAMNETVEKVIIPVGIEEIADDAFEFSTKLKEINIASTVNRIGSYAFYGCALLTDVTIPANVKIMGKCVFADSGRLTKGYYDYNAQITVTVPYKEGNLPNTWDTDWCNNEIKTVSGPQVINVNYAG